MKAKKLLTIAAATLFATTCAAALAACGDDPSSDSSKAGVLSEVTFEAEYTNLDGKQGVDISAEPKGKSLVVGGGEAACSNGYYVGATYMDGFTLEFDFKAETDGDGVLTLALASELGNITLTPDNFGVVLNGAEINYSQMSIKGSSRNAPEFQTVTVTSSAAIKSGDNTLKLVVRANTLREGSKTGGPMIDCVKIKTKAGLSWTPKTDNTNSEGGIGIK